MGTNEQTNQRTELFGSPEESFEYVQVGYGDVSPSTMFGKLVRFGQFDNLYGKLFERDFQTTVIFLNRLG